MKYLLIILIFTILSCSTNDEERFLDEIDPCRFEDFFIGGWIVDETLYLTDSIGFDTISFISSSKNTYEFKENGEGVLDEQKDIRWTYYNEHKRLMVVNNLFGIDRTIDFNISEIHYYNILCNDPDEFTGRYVEKNQINSDSSFYIQINWDARRVN